MNETKLSTIAQLQDFLKATPEVSFSGIDEKGDNERYPRLNQTQEWVRPENLGLLFALKTVVFTQHFGGQGEQREE